MRGDGKQLRRCAWVLGGTATGQGGGSWPAPGETLFQVTASRVASLPNEAGAATRELGHHWRTIKVSTVSI